jgi:phosphohistidine phosphatase SixA
MLRVPIEESITFHTIAGILRATLDRVPDHVRDRAARTIVRALVTPTADGRFILNHSSIVLARLPDQSTVLTVGHDPEFEDHAPEGTYTHAIPIGRPYAGIPQRTLATFAPDQVNPFLRDLFHARDALP